MKLSNGKIIETRGYAPVNGLKMYYEIEGAGDPLVFIPPAFQFAGLKSFPALLQNHSVITVDLQGHGRTADIPERPLSIEQYAKDVMALLEHLGIAQADFFGESYGGNTAAMIAVRQPELVRRVVTYSATFGPPQVALNPKTTRFERPLDAGSRGIQFQRESYRQAAPDPTYWPKVFQKLVSLHWEGFTKEELASIKGSHPHYCRR
jgi:pimeloyl-ACP methyl ester carboxylesterase